MPFGRNACGTIASLQWLRRNAFGVIPFGSNACGKALFSYII
jgi:hypothetical protein